MTSSILNESKSVAIVIYPNVLRSAVLGLGDLFSIANKYSGENGVSQLIVHEVGKQDMKDLSPAGYKAVILLPNLKREFGSNDHDIHAWLRAQHATGSIICSACIGAFWLGYSGLLSGRPATTHWLVESKFREAFPKVQLHVEQLLIDDHDIVTAGGYMAWVDLGLLLVRRYLGVQVAIATARHMLVDLNGREQRNYRSFLPPLTHGDMDILGIQHWLEKKSAVEITVRSMAARAKMPERTFIRRFKTATGYTPNSYFQHVRIEKARGLLERTNSSVGEIGWQVGYRDPSAFSRVFKTLTGVPAGDYRKRFRAIA